MVQESHMLFHQKWLLDANEEDTKEYFEQFGLDNDLLGQVFRYKETWQDCHCSSIWLPHQFQVIMIVLGDARDIENALAEAE